MRKIYSETPQEKCGRCCKQTALRIRNCAQSRAEGQSTAYMTWHRPPAEDRGFGAYHFGFGCMWDSRKPRRQHRVKLYRRRDRHPVGFQLYLQELTVLRRMATRATLGTF